MAASADHYSFPSKEEIEAIKCEIIALENEVVHTQKVIERAQLRLKELTWRVSERKSRIAPGRKATFDVLSSILERCSEIDWKSPLRIGGVSRRWREVILHTPRAWSFINMSRFDEAGIHAYFERSGQCGLHLTLNFLNEVEQLTLVSHRVQCLALSRPFPPSLLENLAFPRLTRLRGPVHSSYRFRAVMTPLRFPNLRHLELRNVEPEVNKCEELSSLQTLKIKCIGDGGWTELLKACKNRLVSLEITLPLGGDIFLVPQIELSNLRYLKVVDEYQNDCSWASFLETPALRAYCEESNHPVAREPRERAESITHLRLERVPATFPKQLRVLQLDIVIEEIFSLVTDLENDPSLFPHLQILEFGQSYVVDFQVANMEKMLGECDWQVRPGLLRPPAITAKWSVSFPDEIEAECGEHMPCALW